MANKYLAKGSKITVAVSSTQTLVPGVSKITPPDDGMDLWDATDLSDTDTVMAPTGYMDPGKVTFDVFFDSKSATHAQLMAAKYSKAIQSFVITGPTSDPFTFTFTAYVTKFTTPSEVKKGMPGSVELSLPTPAVFAAAP